MAYGAAGAEPDLRAGGHGESQGTGITGLLLIAADLVVADAIRGPVAVLVEGCADVLPLRVFRTAVDEATECV